MSSKQMFPRNTRQALASAIAVGVALSLVVCCVRIVTSVITGKSTACLWNYWQLALLGLAMIPVVGAIFALFDFAVGGRIGFNASVREGWGELMKLRRDLVAYRKRLFDAREGVWQICRSWLLSHAVAIVLTLIGSGAVVYGEWAYCQPKPPPSQVAKDYATIDISSTDELRAACVERTGIRIENGALKLDVASTTVGRLEMIMPDLPPMRGDVIGIIAGTSLENLWLGTQGGAVIFRRTGSTGWVVMRRLLGAGSVDGIRTYGPNDTTAMSSCGPVVQHWNGEHWTKRTDAAGLDQFVDNPRNKISVRGNAVYDGDAITGRKIGEVKDPGERLSQATQLSTGDIVALSTNHLYRLKGAGITYRPSGEAIMKLTPRPGQVNKWLGVSRTAITTDGATVKLEYSDRQDGAWHDDIADVPASKTLFVRVRLSATDTHGGLPVLTSVGINYESLAQTKE